LSQAANIGGRKGFIESGTLKEGGGRKKIAVRVVAHSFVLGRPPGGGNGKNEERKKRRRMFGGREKNLEERTCKKVRKPNSGGGVKFREHGRGCSPFLSAVRGGKGEEVTENFPAMGRPFSHISGQGMASLPRKAEEKGT